MEPGNIATISHWNENLFCPFCGMLIWNAENPGDFDHCPHYLFTYGLGAILDHSEGFARFVGGNEHLGLDEIIYECSYSFPNFLAICIDDASDPAIIGLAAAASREYS